MFLPGADPPGAVEPNKEPPPVLIATLTAGMVFGADSICVALDRQRRHSPRFAASAYT